MQCCWPTPTSQPLRILSKQWPSSHYAPGARPLAGPFPRRYTNPTAWLRTSLLTEGTFQENVNSNECHQIPTIIQGTPNQAFQVNLTVQTQKRGKNSLIVQQEQNLS